MWYLWICFYTSHGFTLLTCWFVCNCTCSTVVHVSFCFCSLFFVVSFVCDHFQVWTCFSLEFLFSALLRLCTVCLCVQCVFSFHTGLCYRNAVHKQSQLSGEKKKIQKKISHCIRIRSQQRLFTNQTASLLPFASVYSVYSVFIQVFVIAMLFISKASWVVKKKKKPNSHCIRIRSKPRLFTNQTASLDSFLGRMPVVCWGEFSRVNVGFNTLRPWCGLLTHWGHHQFRQKIPQRLDGLFKNVS